MWAASTKISKKKTVGAFGAAGPLWRMHLPDSRCRSRRSCRCITTAANGGGDGEEDRKEKDRSPENAQSFRKNHVNNGKNASGNSGNAAAAKNSAANNATPVNNAVPFFRSKPFLRPRNGDSQKNVSCEPSLEYVCNAREGAIKDACWVLARVFTDDDRSHYFSASLDDLGFPELNGGRAVVAYAVEQDARIAREHHAVHHDDIVVKRTSVTDLVRRCRTSGLHVLLLIPSVYADLSSCGSEHRRFPKNKLVTFRPYNRCCADVRTALENTVERS